ncbi:zona pellucida binding protein 2 L homeolog precursor [Xenopus laevis]|uniref:Zona pellucida binding protein n=2 Tax=Xenopus laevis TaxID=8355 RepID=A3F966_XENLA|nr:zona pellucida binding protein 2 L homeolog precursor [Xenopus laevis]AAI69916.1 Zona pellucida binding protein [Xenopus laevis]AAI69922.1 Zona pellucida binding protein [Xenopus laevis]ABN41552.1 zona pellucida binding protein [Xenopus laevis]OCT62073.1 hypothetical protein XELAEV_18043157mg [Xenopus laevis]
MDCKFYPALCLIWQFLVCLFIVRVKTTKEDTPLLGAEHIVYGKLNHKVSVFVELFKNSPFLACMDIETANDELIDPMFVWLGPNERLIKGHISVNLTETGKLMMKSFRKSMSGSYNCMVRYLNIKNGNKVTVVKSFSFTLLAYHEPDYTYQFNVRYSTESCGFQINDRAVEWLIGVMEEIVKNFTCKVVDSYHKCHTLIPPHQSLQRQLFISFTVLPLGPKRDEDCPGASVNCIEESNSRVQQARDNIVDFFLHYSQVQKKHSVTFPRINYVEHSLDIRRLDSCRPGFGNNLNKENDCSGCCVICEPRTFSEKDHLYCEICENIRIDYYGANYC